MSESTHKATPARAQAAGAAWCLGGGLFLVTEALAARRFTPAYSYSRDFISSLGVPGRFHGFKLAPATSPLHAVMNAGFIAEGVLFVTALALIAPLLGVGWRRWAFLAIGLVHGAGLVLVGLFHAGGVSRTDGTVAYHALGAVLAILGGNVAILISPATDALGAPVAIRRCGRIGPVVGLLAVAALLVAAALHDPDFMGLWERLSVYPVIGWELLFGGWLLLARRP